MTIMILFLLDNVMRAGLICLSNVEHGKMVKKYTLNIDETQSEYSMLIVTVISTFFKVKMSWRSYYE